MVAARASVRARTARPEQARRSYERTWPSARHWVRFWPLLALLFVFIEHAGRRTAWISAFFMLIMLWPASLAVARIFGLRAGAYFGAVCVALLGVQIILPPPLPRTQPVLLEHRFSSPTEVARHTMRLPVGTAQWERLWSAHPNLQAYVYVMVATDDTVESPMLVAKIGERDVRTIDTESQVVRAGGSNGSSRHWHRLPISRDQLEAAKDFVITVSPQAAYQSMPGRVGLAGGYSYRPTVPGTPSELLVGDRWTTDPHVLLPILPADAASRPSDPAPVRYFIELRFIDTETGLIKAIYY